MTGQKIDNNAKLSVWQLICLNALSLPLGMAGLAFVTIIPTFYAMDIGFGLGLVGMIFVVGRLIDVITDPVIGHLSDKTQRRNGTRLPWVILSVPLFCLAVWFLFSPPASVSLVYLVLASSAYFFFVTVLDIPYSSIAIEISSHMHERSVIASYKGVAQVLGATLVAFIPFVFTLETNVSLVFIAKIVSVFCLISTILFVLFVPKREVRTSSKHPKIVHAIFLAWKNVTYRRLISVFFLIQTANALTAGLTVLFVTHIIGRPDLIGLYLGVLLLSSALFFPLWIWVSKRWSKKIAWSAAILLCCAMLTTAPFLDENNVIFMFGFCIVIGGAFGCDAIMPTSMLADIVYIKGSDQKPAQAGLFLAIKNAASKLTFIAPMGIAFPVLEWVGLKPNTGITSGVVLTLVLFYAVVPIGLRLIALKMLRTTLNVQRGLTK